MNRTSKAALMLLTLASAFSRPGNADPRWWWHDRAISPSPASGQTAPDVAIASSSGTTSGGSGIFAVWEEAAVGIPGGIREVRLDASFNGGCTFCGSVVLATASLSSTRPRIAVATTDSGRYSIQVVFERGREIYVAVDTSISTSDPKPCDALRLLRPPTPVQLSTVRGANQRPRIALMRTTASPRALHFHAVWGVNGRLQYEHDLIGDGTGWTNGGYRDLSDVSSIGEPGEMPDISVDPLADTSTQTSPTVWFLAAGLVRMARSTDSGNAWSHPSVQVSGSVTQTAPAADTNAGGPIATMNAWNGVAFQGQPGPGAITMDAANWTSPTARMPDFDGTATDVPISLAPPPAPSVLGVEPAFAIAPGFSPVGPGDSTSYVFWSAPTATAPELYARDGVLSTATPPFRDYNKPAMGPTRVAPADPATSVPEPFSNCLWDDGWPTLASQTCAFQPRGAGSLGGAQVACDDTYDFNGGPMFVAVFSDDRLQPGTPQVYFKRTDSQVGTALFRSAPDPAVVPRCEKVLTPAADVYFPLLPECGKLLAERIDRYLIYYGSEMSEAATPSGPFANRRAVANQALTNPWKETISPLKPGETYDFALIGEDEARNISPASFDPLKRGNTHIDAQRAKATMPGCRPILEHLCTVTGEACGTTSDGIYGPGDIVHVTLKLTNFGDFEARDITGTVSVTDATILSPPLGAINVAGPVAIGGSVDVLIDIKLKASCPIAPVITLNPFVSDVVIDQGSRSCPLTLTPLDCAKVCGASSCLVSGLGAIQRLLAVKEGTPIRDNIRFEWQPDTGASTYHVNQVLLKTDVPAPFSKRVDVPMGRGAAKCDVTAPNCNLPAVVAGNEMVYYQAYAACTGLGADEGPFWP